MPKNAENTAKIPLYRPSEAVQDVTKKIYGYLDEMLQVRDQTYPQFNDRTLLQFIDDGDKRLNAYTPSKDAYDPPKEDWQSNVALATVKDRQMKTLAGFSFATPDFTVKAFGEEDIPDLPRAETAKWLVVGSYQQEENVTLQNFWQAWENARCGTVVVYEGYLKTRVKQKFIKSYDIVTGKIETDEREVDTDDQCISYSLPITEFYPWSINIHDVQDQPRVAWVRYLDKALAEREFSKYANWKYVLTAAQLSNIDPDSFYYKQKWEGRIKGNDVYEVVRMYDKTDDSYRIIVNGVLLLDAPLLWSSNGRKMYPFAKTIWMPFSGKNFFYGQSFPDYLRGIYDQENTVWNTASDKQYRGMVPVVAVGRVNTDAMNLEDEVLLQTTKVTVEDVNQIREIKTGGLDNSDVQMLNLIGGYIDSIVPSLPDMFQGKDATAREIVISNERIQEQKSLYSEMMVDLWRQKYALRLANIQQNYPQPRKIMDGNKVKTVHRMYTVQNALLDRMTNEIGTLAIQFMDIKGKKADRMAERIDEEEQAMREQGMAYRKIIVPTDYLDTVRTNIEMIPSSIYKQMLGYQQATVLEKMDIMQKLFPEYFVANQSDLFAQFSAAYDDDPAKYERNMQQLQQQMQQLQAGNAAPAEGKDVPPPEEAAPVS